MITAKVKLAPLTTYGVYPLDEKGVPKEQVPFNMKVESKWECFTKLVDNSGRHLIVASYDDDPATAFSRMFDDVFGRNKDKTADEQYVIAGSITLLRDLGFVK